MLKKIFIAVVIFFNTSFPQVIESSKDDLKNFFKVGGDVFSSPVKFNSKDWLYFSLTLGLTTTSTLIDGKIQAFSSQNKGSFADALFKIDDYYHIEFMAASIAALYIYGTAAKNKEVRNLGLKLTEATVYSGTITLLTKFLFGRERPENSTDPYNFKPFNASWNLTSMPSGHTTLAFAYSTVMASAYKNFYWKFGWYSLAALVGAARVYNNAHWFSDVLLGSAIGYFVGEFVNEHKTNQKPKNNTVSSEKNPDFSVSFKLVF